MWVSIYLILTHNLVCFNCYIRYTILVSLVQVSGTGLEWRTLALKSVSSAQYNVKCCYFSQRDWRPLIVSRNLIDFSSRVIWGCQPEDSDFGSATWWSSAFFTVHWKFNGCLVPLLSRRALRFSSVMQLSSLFSYLSHRKETKEILLPPGPWPGHVVAPPDWRSRRLYHPEKHKLCD